MAYITIVYIIYFVFSTYTLAHPPSAREWMLTFSDEFEGTVLDTAKWNTTFKWGGVGARTLPGNKELQYYADDAFGVENGTLRIKAERRSVEWYGKTYQYTSGAITSYQTFVQMYGYFEMRARIPKGKGLWPAFWLLPNRQAWPPEIDVLEMLGHEPFRAYMTFHWSEFDVHRSSGGHYDGPDFSQDFHTFAVEWSPRRLIWYIDDVERRRHTNNYVPAEPMHILANLAVGGSWPGSPDENTPFPSYFEIDYIRVYQYQDTTFPGINKSPTVELTAPETGSVFSAPTDIVLTADAEDMDGNIARVLFFNGPRIIGQVNTYPFTFTWEDVTEGDYILRAQAVDDSMAATVSQGVNVKVVSSSGNIILNPEFDMGTQSWSTYSYPGTDGRLSIVSDAGLSGTNALKVEVVQPGSADWHFQIIQGVPIKNGNPLTIQFMAKAAAPKNIRVMFQQNESPYAEYWSESVILSTAAESFGPFTYVPEIDDPNAMFKFLVGNDDTDVWLDNVQVFLSGGTTGYMEFQKDNSQSQEDNVMYYQGNGEFSITLQEKGRVQLTIYNTLGQKVRTLVDDVRPAGLYTVTWDGKDQSGVDVASGIYLCRLTGGDRSLISKMLIVR